MIRALIHSILITSFLYYFALFIQKQQTIHYLHQNEWVMLSNGTSIKKSEGMENWIFVDEFLRVHILPPNQFSSIQHKRAYASYTTEHGVDTEIHVYPNQ